MGLSLHPHGLRAADRTSTRSRSRTKATCFDIPQTFEPSGLRAGNLESHKDTQLCAGMERSALGWPCCWARRWRPSHRANRVAAQGTPAPAVVAPAAPATPTPAPAVVAQPRSDVRRSSGCGRGRPRAAVLRQGPDPAHQRQHPSELPLRRAGEALHPRLGVGGLRLHLPLHRLGPEQRRPGHEPVRR